MKEIFPEVIRKLPKADIPIPGLTAFLSQDEKHQITFFFFAEDVDVPSHSHGAQWIVVLNGEMILTVEGKEHFLSKGDRFLILPGETHSAKIKAGYASMEFFADKDRYKAKK